MSVDLTANPTWVTSLGDRLVNMLEENELLSVRSSYPCDIQSPEDKNKSAKVTPDVMGWKLEEILVELPSRSVDNVEGVNQPTVEIRATRILSGEFKALNALEAEKLLDLLQEGNRVRGRDTWLAFKWPQEEGDLHDKVDLALCQVCSFIAANAKPESFPSGRNPDGGSPCDACDPDLLWIHHLLYSGR
jgi:hypothetical protein